MSQLETIVIENNNANNLFLIIAIFAAVLLISNLFEIDFLIKKKEKYEEMAETLREYKRKCGREDEEEN